MPLCYNYFLLFSLFIHINIIIVIRTIIIFSNDCCYPKIILITFKILSTLSLFLSLSIFLLICLISTKLSVQMYPSSREKDERASLGKYLKWRCRSRPDPPVNYHLYVKNLSKTYHLRSRPDRLQTYHTQPPEYCPL